MSDANNNQEQQNTKDLTEEQVIIIGCVCAAILIILLVILIVIICRRRQRKHNEQSRGVSHSHPPIQPVNGSLGNQKHNQRGLDNPDGVELEHRITHPGFPIPYHPADINALETSYDSQFNDKRYECEMNRRNAHSNGDPYFEKPGDISFVSSHSPQTPTKDPKQFINVPEERKGEGGSGNESGYSTPDPAKPKKVIYEVVV